MKDIEKPASPAVDGRKRYSAPALTEYGSVARLTAVKGGSFVEFGTSKKTTNCL